VDEATGVVAVSCDNYFNIKKAKPTVTITTSDKYDTDPGAAPLLDSGYRTFTITPYTAGYTSATATASGYTQYTTAEVAVNAAAANRLQVLVPNETAEPGDVNNGGKKGAVKTQTAGVGVAFTVTVNATDSKYNPVSLSNSTATVTTEDTNDADPGQRLLTNGTT